MIKSIVFRVSIFTRLFKYFPEFDDESGLKLSFTSMHGDEGGSRVSVSNGFLTFIVSGWDWDRRTKIKLIGSVIETEKYLILKMGLRTLSSICNGGGCGQDNLRWNSKWKKFLVTAANF